MYSLWCGLEQRAVDDAISFDAEGRHFEHNLGL